jgi:hypothetical protein
VLEALAEGVSLAAGVGQRRAISGGDAVESRNRDVGPAVD